MEHYLIVHLFLACAAFGISTTVLAVQESRLKTNCDVQQQNNLVRKMEDYRLPAFITPKAYDLTLEPNLKTGNFSGKANISVNVLKGTKAIKIHSNGLTIEKVTLNGVVAKFELKKKYELLVIQQVDDGCIDKGVVEVAIEYSGDMKNRIVGLYKSEYTSSNGEKRAIATSKFEPTYARQAFPCFDEPNMKATYTVHILKPKDDSSYIALSNMREVGSDIVENGVMVHFEESAKMSTYLTCFIVCDFKFKEKTISPGKANIPLRVYATPAQLEKTEYAATTAVGVIEYFIDYFGIAYPLPKLDLIAIPDFVSGAMEHWGLVTFRETALLYHGSISSTANKQRVATVVAHELAHSWFGNLVTMNWWNDLWLNEGFASYIQYKGVAFVEKDWQMENQFLIETLHSVLSLDATLASHPIVQTVLTPDQITEIFDSITYSKGASILRMLEKAVGEKIFQNGVTAYLKAHAFGNAVTQDLLDELQKLAPSGLNITDFVNTWIVQMGYPILNVVEEENQYVLTQKRFLKDPSKPGNVSSEYGYKWTVPVTYVTDKNAEPVKLWFNHKDNNLIVEKEAGVKWIKFNSEQVGYYRVNYPENQWNNLAKNIEQLTIADQTHLLEESFSIAESGELSYTIPLELTKYLQNSTEYIPWSVTTTKLSELKKYLVDSLQYSNYLDYIVKISDSAYKKISWEEKEGESHLDKRARVTILQLLCSIEHRECLLEASSRFRNWMGHPESSGITQDLRAIVYKYGMVKAGKEEWEGLLEAFKKEIDANEKINMMRGLATIQVPWLLKRLIELGKDEEIIRGQDYFTMLQFISSNPVGTPIVWDYVRQNWEYLVKRFGINERNLGKLIPSITGSFTSQMRLNEMEEFFKKYPEGGAGTAARQQALENVRNNIKWIKNNKEEVEKWIENESRS